MRQLEQTTARKIPPVEAETGPHEEDSVVYADGATIFLQNGTEEQPIARLRKYAHLTRARQLKIQCNKVQILTRNKTKD